MYLIKLGPGNHHVAEVICKVRLVEYLLGQEMLVVVVQIVLCLDLGGEFTVESAVHHPPRHTLRHHEWHSLLMTTTEERLTRRVHCVVFTLMSMEADEHHKWFMCFSGWAF